MARGALSHPYLVTLLVSGLMSLSAAFASSGTQAPGQTAEKGPFATAHLLSADTRAVPGTPLEVAVQFKLAPGWHIYWENPGDSGLKTTVQLKSSQPSTIGSLQYPGPVAFSAPGDSVSYGYANDVILFLRVTPDTSLKPGSTLTLQGEAKWLACQERCVREQAPLSLSLPVESKPSPRSASTERLLQPWREKLPQPLNTLAGVRIRWTSPRELIVEASSNQKLAFFPGVEQGTVQVTSTPTGGLRLSLPPETPAGKLEGLLQQELQRKVRYGKVQLQHPQNAP